MEETVIEQPTARPALDLLALAHQASEVYILFSMIVVAALLGYLWGSGEARAQATEWHVYLPESMTEDAQAILADEAPSGTVQEATQ